MSRTIKTAILHLTSWRHDPRVIMSLLFGGVLCCRNGYSYLQYSDFYGSPVQLFEMYIVNGSLGLSFIGCFLGYLMLMSNAPFINELSSYEIVRSGKKRWIDAKITYVFLGCFIYSLFMLVVSCLFTFFMGKSFVSATWSDSMSELAIRQPLYAIKSFHLSFPYKEYISAVNPYMATVLTVICNSMYAVILSLIIMTVNLISSRNLGWLVASILHVWGYAVFVNGGFWLPFRYSLFCHALPVWYFMPGTGMSIVGSLAFSVALILILREICIYSLRKI